MADKRNSTFDAILDALISSGQYAGETGMDALRGAELGIPFLSRLIASATDETGSQRINRLQKEMQDSPVASRVGEAIPYLARMNPVVLALAAGANTFDKSSAAGRKGEEAAKDAASGATQSIVADTIQRYAPGITKVLPALFALGQSENIGADLLSGAIIKGGTKGGAALLPKTGSNKSVSMIARQLNAKALPGSVDERNLRRGKKSALWRVATASGGNKGRYQANKDAMSDLEASRAETIRKAQEVGEVGTLEKQKMLDQEYMSTEEARKAEFGKSEFEKRREAARGYKGKREQYRKAKSEFEKTTPRPDVEGMQRDFEAKKNEFESSLPDYEKQKADYDAWRSEYFGSVSKPPYKEAMKSWRDSFNAFKESNPKRTREQERAWKRENPQPKYWEMLNELRQQQGEFNEAFPRPTKKGVQAETKNKKAQFFEENPPDLIQKTKESYDKATSEFSQQNPEPSMGYTPREYTPSKKSEAKNPGLINLNEFTQETLDAILNPEKRRETQPNFKGSGRNLAEVKPQQEEFVTALRNFEERQGYTGPTRAPLNLQESSKLFEALNPQADSGTLAGRQVLGHKITDAIGSILGEQARDEYVTQGSDYNSLVNLKDTLGKGAQFPGKSLSSEIQSAPALATGGGGTKALDNVVTDVSQSTGVPKGFLSGLSTVVASQVPNFNKNYITPLRLKGSAVEIPGMGGTQLGDVFDSVATGTDGAVGRGLLAQQQMQSSLAPLSEEEFNALSDEEKIQLMQN